MRDGENIRQVAELGVDWIGMVFCKQSPRNVTMIPTHAGIIPDRSSINTQQQACNIKRVGVFVDEMPQNIITRVFNFALDVVQLHGNETPTVIRNLRATIDPDIRPGVKFVKAISVGCREDIAKYKDYADCVDYFLFDTKVQPQETDSADGVLPGGSGQHFDWTVLDVYDGQVPFILSGGIGPDDAERINSFRHDMFMGIDINSRFETEPGLKDVGLIKEFLAKLNR